MKRYVDKPRAPRASFVASFGPEPPFVYLDDLLQVAKMYDRSAKIAHCPGLDVMVVACPTRGMGDMHEVIRRGQLLVYGEDFDVLYAADPEKFESDHEEAPE